ncbi:MAG: Glycosyl hydrolase family 65 central catalytic domain protein [Candidatus Argoarchaeum ethanivorans]|uniref:Glycosyl hydrolase family 65 central catalytic domain protein n=1 Tax=Candidatus Argoarchaeum ethanivorans TaxID=2608793 RepID=A0A811TI81_9EURY|nr:MAG: Glycosyl hydrolase family 65 central catalytic domain protein [Candidatus Argoarchaeum ethanivorans]
MFFRKYLSDDEWLIRECKWDPDPHKQGSSESIFSLGNGYVGSRGVMEEIPDGSRPGTYIAGIFDKSAAKTVEIVNLPNPIDFQIYANGEPVAIDKMDVVRHERILDMKKGLLFRETKYRSQVGLYRYQSMRAISASDEHTAMMRVCFVSYDSNVDILVKNSTDTAALNIRPEMDTMVRHYDIRWADYTNNICYVAVKTNDSGIIASYATDLSIWGDGELVCAARTAEWEDGKFTENVRFKARKGVIYSFDKLISLCSSRDLPEEGIRDATINTLEQSRCIGFECLLETHAAVWDRRWLTADITIAPAGETGGANESVRDVNRAMRFNLYHLLAVGNEHDDQASIAPKALTSEWYGGHVLWDTTIFVFPFFLFTNPVIARNLLMYRYHRLDIARKNAKSQDLEGALFPWESAATGEDVTPKNWVNLKGELIKVHTMEREQHIVGDVAYAVYHYYMATADEEFMARYGTEIMLETARFWASRVTYSEETGRYEIRNVIGPNEYQECVDNNAYTNYLARWNLRCAISLCTNRPAGAAHGLEIDRWQKIADGITFTVLNDGMIEEFDGYFGREDVIITKMNNLGIPTYPQDDVPMTRVAETQLVKQADVMMLLHLFPHDFSLDVKRANMTYYERRTTHESSLSPSIHASLYAEIGNADEAYHYFRYALYGTIGNVYGNTHNGIHAGSMGGVWQATIFGFAGVRMKDGILSVNPRLPGEWGRLRFNLFWHGTKLEFNITHTEVEISSESSRDFVIPVVICGEIHELAGNGPEVIEYGNDD